MSVSSFQSYKYKTKQIVTIFKILIFECGIFFHFIINTSRSFPRSWLITGFITRFTRRVSLVEQELLTLPEHLSSSPVFSGVRVIRSLVLYVSCVDRYLSFCTFSFAIVLSFLLRYTILIAPLVSSSSSIETIQYHALLHCHIIICSDLVVCLLRCTASW